MRRTIIFSVMLLTIISLVACATRSPSPTGTTATAPPVPGIAVPGEQVPFEVCGESTTWSRPTEEEQKAEWWDSAVCR